MPEFSAKMHQIQFWPRRRIRRRGAGGAYSAPRPPPPPSWCGGDSLLVHVQKNLQMDSIILNLIIILYGTVREIYRDGIPKSNVGLLCGTLR